MIITIECDCGNKVSMAVLANKYIQLRDNLKTKDFRYDGATAKKAEVEEIRITCKKCGRWMDLGVD